MNRRQAMLTGAAAVAVCALPASAVVEASPVAPITAEMFYTTDEPWGLWVKGHVSTEQYQRAALALIEKDPDVRENTEEWLWDATADDEGNTIERAIVADPQHKYMRLDRTDDPDLGDVYEVCGPDAPGAIPITIVSY